MAFAVAQCIRSWWMGLACLAVVVVALLLPPPGFLLPSGAPVPMCQFKEVTHLPCPACGLTRSFVGMAHLDVARALRFHPLGVVLFPAVLTLALLLPAARTRERAAAWVESHPRPVHALLIVLGAAFVSYGFGRIAWLMLTGSPSIW